LRARLADAPDLVVAADSGLDAALALGLRPAVVVGDLDSVSPAALAGARDAGIPIIEHPRDKEFTDLELALDTAVDHGATSITVVSGGAGRLDHLVAGLVCLVDERFAAAAIDAWIGMAHVLALRAPARADIPADAGALVSLVPVGGPALGVRTTGLRFPLHGETLSPTAARGVSNEALAPPITVSLTDGALLVIVPEALEVP
jgi:thiamine pyrophosphokinase